MLPKSYAWVFVHYGEIDTIRLLYVSLYPEMGVRSWFCVPALLRSRYFRNAGMQIYTGTQKRGTQKNRNTKFAFLWRDDTVMMCTERRGERGGLWTRYEFDPKPASRQYTRTPRTRDEGGLMASWPRPPDPSIHMQCVIDESHPHPPHIHSLTQEHRNAKQECKSTGKRKKMSNRNAGIWNMKEKSRNAGTRERKGPQERAPISGVHSKLYTNPPTWTTVLGGCVRE